MKITCLGGGNAMPKVVLRGLKDKDVSLTAVCAMLDSGGSSGRLKEDYNIRAPGDLRRALIALANTSPAIERLFDYRFEVGELGGHNFANLFIASLELSGDDYLEAVEELKSILHIEHEVLPVTLDKSELFAKLEDGTIVRGETNIDRPQHDSSLKIESIFLVPQAHAYPQVLDSILEADMVVIGPGDLYSTLAQILLVSGVAEALQRTEAKIVYITNLMRKKGETEGFTVDDFSSQIEEWMGRGIDLVLANKKEPSKERVRKYLQEHEELLGLVPGEGEYDLIRDEGPIEHDPEKVAETLLGR